MSPVKQQAARRRADVEMPSGHSVPLYDCTHYSEISGRFFVKYGKSPWGNDRSNFGMALKLEEMVWFRGSYG